jgi:hypothetical protein
LSHSFFQEAEQKKYAAQDVTVTRQTAEPSGKNRMVLAYNTPMPAVSQTACVVSCEMT